jgi:Xaa-Pro aminopeptidase
MVKERVGAMLLTNPFNVRYFSGFTGEDSYLLVGGRWVRLLTDSRFTEQAKLDCPGIPAVIRTGRMTLAIQAVFAKFPVRVLGIEGDHVTISMQSALAKALKPRLKALGSQVGAFREVKDDTELAAINRAVRAAQQGFELLVAGGAAKFVGRTERQVAAELEYLMKTHGAEKPSFDTIVAAGAHAALPHHQPGDTRIRRGDSVLIDWGAMAGGYCSDLTRVVFTGKIPAQLARMYDVVHRAQQAGFSAVKAGVACQAVDAAARAVIAEAGLGEAFGHGLGHGLGLEIHEAPGLGKTAKGELSAGMVVTVEPGVYLPGVGGVRIEDDVLVTKDGCRRLTSLTSDIKAMMLK